MNPNDKPTQETENEFEFKNLLTKDEYQKLCKHFNVNLANAKNQVNHYFDTKFYDLLNHQTALRARKKKGIWELTSKEDQADGSKLETHYKPLGDVERSLLFYNGILPISNVANVVEKYTNKHLFHLGELSTNRITIDNEYGQIMLDANMYLHKFDWEIEFEIHNPANRAAAEIYLLGIFQKFGIKREQAIGKLQRFINLKRTLNK